MIHIRGLGLKVSAAVCALDSGVTLAEILICLCCEVLEKVMTAQTCLGKALKAAASIRADKGACPSLKLVWVLGGNVIL